MVLSGSRDGTIKIWNVVENKKLRCLTDINAHSVNNSQSLHI